MISCFCITRSFVGNTMKLLIADSEYRRAYSREIDISEFAWSPADSALVFTMGISDGFYPSNYVPPVRIQRICFERTHVRILVKTEAEVDLLALDLVAQDAKYAETRRHVRM